MSMVRVRTRPRVGMGALTPSGVSYNDTGEKITPDNFSSLCCQPGVLWGQNFMGNVDECVRFAAANASLFGAESYCSDAGLKNLTYPAPVRGVKPVPPPQIDTDPESPTYGQAINPCTGLLVVTAQDAADLHTCLAQKEADAQRAAVIQQMGENADAQCAAMKVECANRAFARFLAPSADCTECVFDWTRTASLFLVAGVVVGGLVIARSLVR